MTHDIQHDEAERPARFPWPPLLLGASVLISWWLGEAFPMPWPGLDDAPARFIGWGLGGAGVLLLGWAAITLRNHHTTILPHKGAETLVTSGPFRYRRNPIYLADVLLILGLAEVTKNIWLVAGAASFAGLVTWLAIRPEERHLEDRFGQPYRDYMARTRRWI